MNASVSQILLNRIRFKHLQMLVALGVTNNLHRTAEALHVSQPGITRMLQEVEEMLGCALFERRSRGMAPNELGEQVLRFARNTLATVERFASDFTEFREGGYGHLAVGAVMGAAPDLVVNALVEIKTFHPRLRIRIMGDTTDQLIDLLERGQIDVAIARDVTADRHDSFSFEAIGNEQLCLAVRRGHPLLQTRQNERSLKGLCGKWPWLLQSATTPTRIAFDLALAKSHIAFPKDIVECSSVFAMLQMVQLTDAIMLLSETVVRDHVKSGVLGLLSVETGATLPPFGVVLRRNETPSPQLRTFLRLLREMAGVAEASHAGMAQVDRA